jgi:2-polyprenyl-3-methyl-5-hydroxy-6-metoxy-1,4-benzoquinol methylase
VPAASEEVSTVTVLDHPDGSVRVEEVNGHNVITVEPRAGVFSPRRNCVTSYPLDLIEHVVRVKGAAYVCDEIMRDEDPNYVQRSLQRGILSYRSEQEFVGRRVLDFGSGSGSSSLVLSRLLPGSHIVGIDLDSAAVALAQHRARFYGIENRTSFHVSPDAHSLPAEIEMFDYIVASAVYEHLLPEERCEVLPMLWSHLKQDGLLFVNQTPYRWFPVEMHTTGLPAINYLPDRLALAYARRFSRRVRSDESWEELLRRGIRGGSPGSIRRILDEDDRTSEFLDPSGPGISDHIDLWYRMPNNSRRRTTKTLMKYGFRVVKTVTGQIAVPSLTLAIRKVR